MDDPDTSVEHQLEAIPDSLWASLFAYGADSRLIVQLWCRAFALVEVGHFDDPGRFPETYGELFDVVYAAWQQTHPESCIRRASAWKLLAGRSRNPNKKPIPFKDDRNAKLPWVQELSTLTTINLSTANQQLTTNKHDA